MAVLIGEGDGCSNWMDPSFASINNEKLVSNMLRALRWIAQTPTMQRFYLLAVSRWYRRDRLVDPLEPAVSDSHKTRGYQM